MSGRRGSIAQRMAMGGPFQRMESSGDVSHRVSDLDPTRSEPLDGHNDLEIQLERELYTAAFVSPLHLCLDRGKFGRRLGQWFALFAMIVTAFAQVAAVMGLLAYVLEQHLVYDGRLEFATTMLLKADAPMDAAATADLCGNFVRTQPGGRDLEKQLTMADGTAYKSSENHPIFQSWKMPTGDWHYTTDGSYLDIVMRITRGEWFSIYKSLPFQGYSVTFVLMLGLHFTYCLVEARAIGKFFLVLRHFSRKKVLNDVHGTTSFDDDGCMTIEALNHQALAVGWTCVILRTFVMIFLLVVGTYLLQACTNQLRLVLNAIALGFVFEFDGVFAYAVLNHNSLSLIESIRPIKVRAPPLSQTAWFSLLLWISLWASALFVRLWQVFSLQGHLNTVAALCLFAGAAPGVQHELFVPAEGFCESMLSATCAPSVTGPGKKHGPCVVSDLTLFHNRTMMFPADEEIFEKEYDDRGERRGFLAWGEPKPLIKEAGLWAEDPMYDTFRKICVQMYQPLRTRLVANDDDSETHLPRRVQTIMPFYCRRDKLLNNVFGTALGDFSRWSESLQLTNPEVAAAIDACREEDDAHPTKEEESNAKKHRKPKHRKHAALRSSDSEHGEKKDAEEDAKTSVDDEPSRGRKRRASDSSASEHGDMKDAAGEQDRRESDSGKESPTPTIQFVYHAKHRRGHAHLNT